MKVSDLIIITGLGSLGIEPFYSICKEEVRKSNLKRNGDENNGNT